MAVRPESLGRLALTLTMLQEARPEQSLKVAAVAQPMATEVQVVCS